MAKIANLSADLVANTATFEADLKRADRALSRTQTSWQRDMRAIDKQFNSLGNSASSLTSNIFSLKAALPALGAALGVQAIISFSSEVRRAIEAVGGLGEVASQVGVSTDALQAFRYAATQVGLSADEMDAGLTRLTRTIGDAATGNKAAIDTFNALGVGVLDFEGKVRPTEEVLRSVANAISQIDDPAKRASVLVDLLGKSGQKLAPLLEEGAGGIDALIGRAKALGLVFDEETIGKADAAADAIAEMELRVGKLYDKALLLVGVPIVEWLDQFTKRGADFAHGLFSDDTLGSLEQLQRDLATLTEKRNNLAAEVTNEYIGGLAGQEVAKLDAQITDLEQRIAKISAEQGQRMGRGDPLPFAGTNPLPKETGSGSTKKSPAELQAEKLAKTIADLQLQVDTFDMGEVDTKIAEAMAGIDQSLPGAKEAVTTISNLIQQLGLLKQARDEDAADVAEYDRIIAETDAAWQKRVADGKAIMESVRTPAEEYAATLETIRVALAAGTITQEDFNRKLDEAQEKLKEAEGTGFDFREMADEAAGALASGITDAVFEADNLNEALLEIVKTLGKMVMQKLLLKAFDVGLDAIFGESATGGPEGGLTLVGERGPELVNLPAGSYVNTAKMSGAMMGQRVSSSNIGPAGGIVVNAPITIEGSAGTPEQNADLAAKMQDSLERAVERAVDSRISEQQRSGGILNPGMGF